MSTPSKRIALETALEVDRLCDQFEHELLSAVPPSIEAFLDRVDRPAKAQVFEQILAMELESCSVRPLLADYIKRFPEYELQIQSVWEELGLLDWTNSEIGRFQIVKELGRGGMGVVFLAEDPRLNRQVAIKLLIHERQSDSEWLKQFEQEARIASGLNHPNVLTIYEIGDDQGIPFIASEYVDGITLREKTAAAPLATPDCLDISAQIALGMAEAHRAGIIHRDLKTDNVMIRNDGIVKILDFGLAQSQRFERPQRLPNAQTAELTGTVHFMSPEQASRRRLTSASDVFSFGVLVYRMLTGELPFDGSSVAEIIEGICAKEPREIEVAVGISEPLKQLVAGCLNKSPVERPDFVEICALLEAIRGASQHSVEPDNVVGNRASGENEPAGENELAGDDNLLEASELQPSDIRYTQSGDVNIAWQTIGDGPLDIVFVMGWVSHLDWFWKHRSFARFLQQIARFSRVILFDKRGTGLSDRVPVNQLPDLGTRMDDVRAVMEAAGSERAVLCGVSEGGPLCALFAATHPDKTGGLVMVGSYSRRLWAEDYPWGPTQEKRDEFLKTISRDWGGPVGIEERAPSMAKDPEFRKWWANYLRMGASPGAAVALTKMNAEIDVRPVLPTIQVPTLVVHRTDDRCLLLEEGKYLADRIPGAKFVELPGKDHLPFVGDFESIVDEIQLFLADASVTRADLSALASVLFIKIAEDATAEQESKFNERALGIVERFRGTPISSPAATYVFAFDGPLRSVQCALELCELARRNQVQIHCGLETGPCQFEQDHLVGDVVDRARVVANLAAPCEVWLTNTLANLISSEAIEFTQPTTEFCRATWVDQR